MSLTLEDLAEMKLRDFIPIFEKQCNVKLAYVDFNSHSNLDILNDYIHNLNKDRQASYDSGDVAKLLDIYLKKTIHKEENSKTIDISKAMDKLMEEDFFREFTNNKKTEKKYTSSRLSKEELQAFEDGTFWDNL